MFYCRLSNMKVAAAAAAVALAERRWLSTSSPHQMAIELSSCFEGSVFSIFCFFFLGLMLLLLLVLCPWLLWREREIEREKGGGGGGSWMQPIFTGNRQQKCN